MTPISKRNQYLDSFLANIRLEKGLSSNTIKAYEIGSDKEKQQLEFWKLN